MSTKKFSQFTNGTYPRSGDKYVGERSGANIYIPGSGLHPRALLDNNVAPFNNISVANNTFQKLQMDNLAYDTGSFWSVSHPTRLTIPSGLDGLYLIFGSVYWDNGTVTGVRELDIYINNAAFQPASANDGTTTRPNRPSQSVCVPFLLSAGDYIELVAYQTSGGALNILQTDWSPVLSIVFLGP